VFIKSATDLPTYRQARTPNELRKLDVFVSPPGVRSIWLHHDLAKFKNGLKALAARLAQEGIILTEAHVHKLWKRRNTTMKLVARSNPLIPVISGLTTRSMSEPSKVSVGSISRPISMYG
jgi:hypothetical protein